MLSVEELESALSMPKALAEVWLSLLIVLGG